MKRPGNYWRIILNHSFMTIREFIKIGDGILVSALYKSEFERLNLLDFDGVFEFSGGENLGKSNLADYRERIKFRAESPVKNLFLKRYSRAPLKIQFKNFFAHRKLMSCACAEYSPARELKRAGVNTFVTVASGEERRWLLEKRSFIITEEIAEAESLERRLPDYVTKPVSVEDLQQKRRFLASLAGFIVRFHETGYRHRDLYFSHIFYDTNGHFHLIDLARAFKPLLYSERYRIKDLAQLFYSAPASCFSSTDRLRFYLALTGHNKLTDKDKHIIGKIIVRAKRMARHDRKHGREVPYKN